MSFLRLSYGRCRETRECDPAALPSSPEDLRSSELMSDLVFPVVSIVFFLVAVAYLYGCQSLKGGRDTA